MIGYLWALISIFLVTGAQLCLKWAMTHLSLTDGLLPLFRILASFSPAVLLLIAGLAAYLFSVFFWFLTLHHLSISRAYPLLSVSYILVWLIALAFPCLNETFHWETLGGVILVATGIGTIFWPEKKAV